jgi:hypothetical protein
VDGFLGPEGHCVDAKHTASTLRGLPENNLGELPVADLHALILDAAQNMDMRWVHKCPQILYLVFIHTSNIHLLYNMYSKLYSILQLQSLYSILSEEKKSILLILVEPHLY